MRHNFEREEEWKRARAEKKRKEAEEEEKLRQQILEKFAEDDKIEQMGQQKRRMKIAEHQREAERLMQLRREEKERQAAAERQAWEEEQARQEERRRLIQEERLRILREHAIKLWGYLPKGVIQNEEELSVFPQEMQDEYRAANHMGGTTKTSSPGSTASGAPADDLSNPPPSLYQTRSTTNPRYRSTRPW